ncbi:GDSL-type esterase/lipase family protein [uncultured Erythrobacter sp.]|uniref:GDSL-type esterase/lipase family protein n=1 Tax=uncultured Erythrobacter sp. TaxID=263913 RepID=UPI00261E952B|nr:GDSL-type esterase/lipase family protein [uncultured Erythrobacter sp.]
MFRTIGLAALVLAAFGWGFSAGAYDLFPYPQARAVKAAVFGAADTANTEYQLSDVPAISAERYSALDTKAEIVMAGDSITASGRWSELFPDASIINRGVPGDRVGGLLARTDDILKAQPSKVFVMIGINDVAARNTNPQIVKRYEALVDRLSEGGAKVFVQSVITCRDTEYSPCDQTMRAQIAELNVSLLEMVGRKGATFVDLDGTFSDQNGVLKRYSIDGIHPGSAGFEEWRRLVAPHIDGEPE